MDAELTRRYANVRAAMAEHDLDALIVSRQRVHRLRGLGHVPLRLPDRAPLRLRRRAGGRRASVVFPTEARYVGEHGTAQLEQVFHDRPGEHIAADRPRPRAGGGSASTASTTS